MMRINAARVAAYCNKQSLPVPYHYRLARCLLCVIASWIGLAAPLHAAEPINGCREYFPVTLTAGFGDTFRFWQNLESSVIPLTVTWDCDRYEIGVFRFGDQYQRINGIRTLVVAQDFAASLSRRWVMHRWGSTGIFFGFGLSVRTRAGIAEDNPFNGSHLNFAEQLGLRWMRLGHRHGVEVSLRHFSNLGIVAPNVGQNFLDVAIVF
jgi:lipid A 3-O-deacylase PagL